jgi:methionine biosynthesis protein MetW
MACPHDALVEFEDHRWSSGPQTIEFRHRTALALAEGGTLLDVGCGDGLMLSLLGKKGIAAEGIDASQTAVTRCIEKGMVARVEVLSGDLPYPDAAFDTVMLLDVLEHVYDPLALLREARRVAKRAVIVSVPNFSSLPARLQVLAGQVPENNRPGKGHLYWFNRRVFYALTAEAGLRVKDLRASTFAPFSMAPVFFTRAFPSLLSLSFVAKLEPLP